MVLIGFVLLAAAARGRNRRRGAEPRGNRRRGLNHVFETSISVVSSPAW